MATPLIKAGQALISDQGCRCSIGACGFDDGGFPFIITAGHCGGTRWHWYGGELGYSDTRLYRPMDTRSIRVTLGLVTDQVHPEARLVGFAEAEVGLQVIRIGAKSGWSKGAVTHLDQIQAYDLGRPVQGQIRTDIESTKGDSGGPIITEGPEGFLLVGFVSGGGVSRTKGPATLAQPARAAFQALGLKPAWEI